MMLVLLCIFAMEPVPLEPLKKQRNFGVGLRQADASSSAPMDLWSAPQQAAWFLSLKLVGELGFGTLGSGIGGAAEVGYRFTLGEHAIGLTLAPEFAGTWTTVTYPLASASAHALQLRVPLLVSGNFRAGPGLARVAIGPSFDWFLLQSSNGASSTHDAYTGLGLQILAGYLFAVGTGALGAELGYHAGPASFLGSSSVQHTLSLALVYLFQQ